MRTTVGPLPPAVYWRRRAVVLGAILLGIIVLFVNCSGDDPDNQHGQGGASSTQYPTPGPGTQTPTDEPSFLDGVPGGNGRSLPNLSDVQSKQPSDGGGDGGPAGGGTGSNDNLTAQTDLTCADEEMAVAPGAAQRAVRRGATVELTLTVKNIGTRTCARDVGAGAQELYLNQGLRKYWSSDTCSAAKGTDVRQFPPGYQRTYRVTWNGRQVSSCAANQASGPNPPPGQFELRARLGTLISSPLTLTIVN